VRGEFSLPRWARLRLQGVCAARAIASAGVEGNARIFSASSRLIRGSVRGFPSARPDIRWSRLLAQQIGRVSDGRDCGEFGRAFVADAGLSLFSRRASDAERGIDSRGEGYLKLLDAQSAASLVIIYD